MMSEFTYQQENYKFRIQKIIKKYEGRLIGSYGTGFKIIGQTPEGTDEACREFKELLDEKDLSITVREVAEVCVDIITEREIHNLGVTQEMRSRGHKVFHISTLQKQDLSRGQWVASLSNPNIEPSGMVPIMFRSRYGIPEDTSWLSTIEDSKEINMEKNWTKELLHTMLAHPDMAVKFFVCSEEVTDFTWTAQKISEITVTPWYWEDDTDERILIDIDEIADLFHDQSEIEDLEERSKEVDKRLRDVERVILVKLRA